MTYYDPVDYWAKRDWTGENEYLKLDRVYPYIDGNSVIDFGCGYGRNYPLFDEMDYVGVDLSENFLERFRKDHPEAETYRADIRTFRFPRRFDLGFTWTVLEHVSQDDIDSVVETMRLLSKRWLIVEPDIPVEKADKLAAHCHRHDYDQLFDVKTILGLGDSLILREIVF